MNTFVKIVIGIILIIAVLIGVFYIEGKTKSASVANITIFIEGQNESSIKITNIEGSLEKVSKSGMPRGGNLVAPGIAITLRQNMIPISDWYSLPLKGPSTYNLKIGLDESFSENIPTMVYVQAIDNKSQEIIAAQKELLLKKQ